MAESINLESIRAKREQVRGEIAKAEAKIAYLRSILTDLDASERVLTFFSDVGPEENAKPVLAKVSTLAAIAYESGIPRGHCDHNPFRKGTNKAYIWDALRLSNQPWLDANEVQSMASTLKGEEIPMATISPTLSNMKGEYIEREGLRVALKIRLNENGEAETSPDTDEVGASFDL